MGTAVVELALGEGVRGEEGGEAEERGSGGLVVGGMTERAPRSFLNQRGDCFAIYPHERRERLG